MMSMMKYASLNPVPCFIINTIGFPAYMVTDAGCRHEISLISSIDKHSPLEFLSTERSNGDYSVALQSDSGVPVQPFITEDFYVIFFYHILKNLLGDMRFKNPHGSGVPINGRRALTFVAVFRSVLPLPCFIGLVVVINFLVEFARDTAYHFLFARVGES